jgi:hypothetical protein
MFMYTCKQVLKVFIVVCIVAATAEAARQGSENRHCSAASDGCGPGIILRLIGFVCISLIATCK